MKNLLIIGFVWPEPKSSAAGTRMLQLIELFSDEGYHISFACTASKTDNSFDLGSIDVDEISIELNDSSFDDFISVLNPDVVMFDRFMIEEQFGWRVSETCPNAIKILDTEDLHFLRKGRQAAFALNKEMDDTFLFIDYAKRELASIYRCDLTLIISEFEMQLLEEKFSIDTEIIHYLPFLLKQDDNSLKNLLGFSERKNFITVGTFLHEPNYQSLLILKHEIWPKIRKELPDAELHIYGAYSSQKVFQQNSIKDGFLIKGFVEDIMLVMKQSRVCLAPLPFGAGLKGKLIDAMMAGTPCVMSPIAAEGMFGELSPNGFIEENTDNFTSRSIELYQSELLWNTSQKAGFEVLKSRFYQTDFKKSFFEKLSTIKIDLALHRNRNFIGQILQHHQLQSTKYLSKWIEEKNKH